MHGNNELGFNTRAVKTYADGRRDNRPLSIPLVQGTTFQFASSRGLGQAFHDRHRTDRVYTRFGHPTLTAAAQKVATLEGAEAALMFDSGMGAISTSLLTVLRAGDHVVAQREIFAQTYTFLHERARSFGVDTDFVDASDLDAVADAIRPETRLVYIETPSNPLLKVVDIERIAHLARAREVLLFVDSTFGSPYLQRPLAHGADLSLQSGTKFLGGHSDIMSGVVSGNAALIRRIKETQILLGGILDPHAAWLLLRGLKTLGVRVQRQCDTALEIARFLEREDGILRVHYPWLESSPHADIARSQMRGGGGVISFEVPGGLDGARSFVDAFELIPVATSLGGVESVVEVPCELDFSEAELGDAAGLTGISPGLIRLSIGLEDLEDLKQDLQRGLRALGAARVDDSVLAR